MEFIDIATERTTAATDAMLALLSIFLLALIQKRGKAQSWKSTLWSAVFGLFSLAAILGTIVHGFKMSESLQNFLWHPLYLSLGLMVSLFVVAAIYDMWGKVSAKKALPLMVIAGVVFFGVTIILPGSFLVFILYEFLATLFSLVVYTYLTIKGKIPGSNWMALAVLLTIIAAVVQATGTVRFTLIWEFDHNGAFHLIQMPALYLFVKGLTKAFQA